MAELSAAERIEKLNQNIAQCERCSLHQTRTHTVPGEGNADADIMFIGEAPGKNEDDSGRPFCGRAGKILDELLESIQLNREDVYICNILKCRPPNNRNPLSSEIQACVGSLDLQIKIINPDIIAPLGTFAATYVFQKFSIPMSSITRVAGRAFHVDTSFGPKTIVPFLHPAVATYNIHKKDDLIRDFQILKDLIAKQERSFKAPQQQTQPQNKEEQVHIFPQST